MSYRSTTSTVVIEQERHKLAVYPELGEEKGGVCKLTEPEKGICTGIIVGKDSIEDETEGETVIRCRVEICST